MRIQVLGPVRAWRDDVELNLGSTAQRAVFGLLAVAYGQPLSRAELTAALWYDRPPRTASNIIQTHVKVLRRQLEPDRPRRAPASVIRTAGDGYVLDVEPDVVDLGRFRRWVAGVTGGTGQDDRCTAAHLLGSALRLWQGAPLTDVPLLTGHAKITALTREYRAALLRYGELMLTTSVTADALPLVEDAAAAHPLDEGVQALLIRVYQAVGQRARAFEVYDRIRRRLVDELGVGPGEDLVAAHAQLLHDGEPPAASVAPTVSTAPSDRAVVPAQLPPDIPPFAGRIEPLRRLNALLRDTRAEAAAPVVIAAIDGTAGVGKTTLAVHWAHSVASCFPDGQLYVDLHGYDRTASPVRPADALHGFLDAFTVAPHRIPAAVEARVGLYRSILAGRRVLVVLDNARDAEQVRPLLPGAPGCFAIVISRHRLTGLVAAQGAVPLTVDLPVRDEARELLARRLGADRVAAEPAAVDDLVDRTARLPLALAVVAARAITRPDLPLAAVATALHRSGGLDAFTGDDDATDARATFTWSYQALDAPAARLFRLLGLHAGPSVGDAEAASLTALPVPAARRALHELARLHLVTESTLDRYGPHDLLRAFAAELAHAHEPEPDRAAAVHRLLDHYVHTACAAARLLHSHREPLELPAPRPGCVVEDIRDEQHAFDWFTGRRQELMAAVDLAARNGFDHHVWWLAWGVVGFLLRRAHLQDIVTSQGQALAATRRTGDRAAQATVHRHRAAGLYELGRFDEAQNHLRQALALHRELGQPLQQAYTYNDLGRMFDRQGRHADAARHSLVALRLFRAADDVPGQAAALNAVGWDNAMLGHHHRALRYCAEALDKYRQVGDRHGEAGTLDSIGYVHHQLGSHVEAVDCYERSLALFRELGDRLSEAVTLEHLGDVQLIAVGPDAARPWWRRALDILDATDHSGAAALRAKLARG